MKATVVTTLIGCFGVDEEKGEILEFVKFPNDPKEIADKLKESKKSKISEEETIENLLSNRGFKKIEKGKSELINKNLSELAIEKKFVKTRAEFNQLISKVNIELAKVDIKKAIGKDKLVMQVSGAIDELDKSINIFIERLREWYGLHFPEMDKVINSNEKYADIVKNFGSRKTIEHPQLSYFRNRSMGIDLNKRDTETVKEFAEEITRLYKMRNDLSKYVDELLKEVAPNTRDIAGPVLTAKLISLAGGLGKLARMPSSTIQLLGAEKALFRHLKGMGKSPKHGVIIMHTFIRRAPKQVSGKLARLIASKISIAAKMDFYSKEYKDDTLKKNLEERVKEIIGKSRQKKSTKPTKRNAIKKRRDK